ncbi:hypothetical protein WJX73_008098 [Symbiochloris irregularis]|uniref:Uncharacterized protein n=1 Tax=Symbiochloris irregularis TaxID=706552 RepID=A0AAW1PH65_9CHLO
MLVAAQHRPTAVSSHALSHSGLRPQFTHSAARQGKHSAPRSSGGQQQTRCIAAPAEAPVTSGEESQCPFAGGRLFTRLTATEPARCPMAGDQVFSTIDREYMPFTDIKEGPWQGLKTGLEPMDPADWMEIDAHYDEEIEEKRQLLQLKPDQTFNVLPGTESLECCQELLEMLSEWLPCYYPDRFRTSDGQLHNLVTGEAFALDPTMEATHPLQAASLLVQEDLCLLKDDGKGRYRLIAGSVAFPMRWSLLQKMGRPMHLIHAPVPFYQKDLRKPVDEFMSSLAPEQAYWRANYGVTDHPYLYQLFSEKEVVNAVKGKHVNDKVEELSQDNAGDLLYLRNERQTLSRLPKTRAVLFTIRTYTRHLREIADRPDLCSRLANALTVTPKDFVNYKTMTGLKDATMGWLGQQMSRHNRITQQM